MSPLGSGPIVAGEAPVDGSARLEHPEVSSSPVLNGSVAGDEPVEQPLQGGDLRGREPPDEAGRDGVGPPGRCDEGLRPG